MHRSFHHLKAHHTSYFDPYRGVQAIKITPGQHCVASSESVIVTVLGSSVTACIRDRDQGIGGMNHVLVANLGDSLPENRQMLSAANSSMDDFIQRLIDCGAKADQLEAKVFGGGNILNGLHRSNAGARSAEVLCGYLRSRKIPVIAADILDIYPRKVYFFPKSGEVLVKKLKNLRNETIIHREKAYSERYLAGDLS
ncbi:MAG: chemoreceptor glutamine deamidase CheD [Methylococcaceae bacterium]|nr:chemoreceptor glutamine deamidase CheD [Methylococcaceae bacterium]